MDKEEIKKVVVSGYFDPLHIGHIDLMRRAKELGDYLIAIVNNDHQCTLKKGKPFMPQEERLEIIKALEMVDEVVLSIDEDRTINKTLEMVNPDIFANGGYKKTGRISEQDVCERLNIEIVNNLGEKLQSSSTLTGLIDFRERKNK